MGKTKICRKVRYQFIINAKFSLNITNKIEILIYFNLKNLHLILNVLILIVNCLTNCYIQQS